MTVFILIGAISKLLNLRLDQKINKTNLIERHKASYGSDTQNDKRYTVIF